MAIGLKEIPRVDYYETFAAAEKLSTLEMFLAVVATEHPSLHRMDVETVFGNEKLCEESFRPLTRETLTTSVLAIVIVVPWFL